MYEPSAETWVNQRFPRVISASPKVIAGLTPTFVTIACATPEATIAVSATARYPAPAWSGRHAEHLLHVEREHEEHREGEGAEQKGDDVRARQRPEAREDPERHEWRLRPQLDDDERGEQDCRGGKHADGLGRAPSDDVRAGEGVDEQDERARDQHRAQRVVLANRLLGAALAHHRADK